MTKTLLFSLACFLFIARSARAETGGALAELKDAAGSQAAAPAPAPNPAKAPEAPPKIVLRTGFYTTAAESCAYDVAMPQDASQIYVTYRKSPAWGSCDMLEGEGLTLSADKSASGLYTGRLQSQWVGTRDLAIKPINGESFTANGYLYILAKAAVPAAAAPQLCSKGN